MKISCRESGESQGTRLGKGRSAAIDELRLPRRETGGGGEKPIEGKCVALEDYDSQQTSVNLRKIAASLSPCYIPPLNSLPRLAPAERHVYSSRASLQPSQAPAGRHGEHSTKPRRAARRSLKLSAWALSRQEVETTERVT